MALPGAQPESGECAVREYSCASPEALARLREQCHGTLLSILLARGASRTEAEDLLADLWADCVPGTDERPSLLEKFSGRCGLQTWLATVVTNRFIDLRRRQARRGETAPADAPEAEGDALDRLAAPAAAVAEGPLTGLLHDCLREAFAHCTSEAMLQLRLVYLHGLTQREVARSLGWSEFKVSRCLSEAMKQIEADTLRSLKQRDPWLELTWQDFVDLCETQQIGFP
jgi:RNA polymerase sigma factor (sigma-70 family)